MSRQSSSGIGTLGESSLHAALKAWYGRSQDQLEVPVDGYVIDIVRDDLLIEIQTRHLYAMKAKLSHLLQNHRVHLVYPIPREKWIVRISADGELVSRRKSPRRGQVVDVFAELVRAPRFITQPNLTLEVVLTQQEEVWRDDGQGSWRRKGWSIADQRLLDVVEQSIFHTPQDLAKLLPELERPFTNRQLADALGIRISLAQKMTYTLRQTGSLTTSGRQGRALLFE